ncbi:MAG: hypothetical protein K5639_04270 [Eubacterium sp.]|nr:hypothetical protein [Eubacterium sp.]
MKAFYRLYVILLVVLFAGAGLFVLLKTPDKYSKNENRYLEKIPAISWEGYMGGEFQRQMDKAVTDQFPMRDLLTGLSTGYRKIVGLHDVGDVYLGKDRYYFDKKLEKDISLTQYEKKLMVIKRFSEGVAQGKDLRLMLVPSPATVLSDKLPGFAKIYDEEPFVTKAKTMLGDGFIDVRAKLMQAAGTENLLYFRTDHHWTHRGAYLGYQAFEESAGREPAAMESFSYQKVSEDFYGTMYSRALDRGAVPDVIEIPTVSDTVTVKSGEKDIPLYHMDKLKEKDQYAVYLGGNDPVVTITNPSAAEDKTILIIKDSFANSFMPLLTNTYKSIVMIDLRYETRPMKLVLDTYQPDEILVLYELSNFVASTEVARLGV